MPERVDRERARKLMERGAQVVEVLPTEEFEEEHLPGALSIPLRELARRSGELERSRPVLVYCLDYQ